MTRWRVVEVRTHRTIGWVEIQPGGAPTGDRLAVDIVAGTLARAGGDVAALDGWTNGYVQVKAA